VRAVITVSDAEGYTRRDDDGQRDLQTWMTNIENQAALNAGLDRGRAYIQGTGDGSHTTWPPETSEFDLITNYLRELRYELDRVNGALSARSRIRMRLSVCAGLVEVGPQGVTGQSAIRASLLVNNGQLRDVLRNAPDRSLAVVIEHKLFEDVVQTRRRGLRPEDYQRAVIRDKYDNDHLAWITVPGDARPAPATSAHAPSHEGASYREFIMSDAISVAVDTLVPFLVAGGGAVAAGAASEAGAELYKSTTSVAAKIGKRLRGRSVDKETVTAALRGALDDGELTMAEIERISTLSRPSGNPAGISIGWIDSKQTFVGEHIDIGRINIGMSDE
jgi:hypothetical protein